MRFPSRLSQGAVTPSHIPTSAHSDRRISIHAVLANRTTASLFAAVAGCAIAGSAAADPILPNPFHGRPAPVEQPGLLPVDPAAARPVQPSASPVELTAGQTTASQSEVQRQLELLYQQNGRPAPEMVNPGIVSQPQTGAQQPGYHQSSFQQPTVSTQPSEYLGNMGPQEPPKRSFLDRILGVFRRDRVPSSPPRDPGMRYPKGPAADSFAGGGTYPNAVPKVPPAVPPVPPAQPGLLPSASASPIGQPVMRGIVPPAPGGEVSMEPAVIAAEPVRPNPLASPVAAKPPQRNSAVREVPELRAMLQQQSAPKALQPAPGAPAEEQAVKSLASSPESADEFDFGQPFVESEQAVDRRRDMDFDLNAALVEQDPQPDADANAADVAGVVPPPPVGNEEHSSEQIEKPYTGVTLEEDMFTKSADMPPAEVTFDFTPPDASSNSTERNAADAPQPARNVPDVPPLPPLPGEQSPPSSPKSELADSENDGLLLIPPMPQAEPSSSTTASTSKEEELPTLDFSSPSKEAKHAAPQAAAELKQAKVAGEIPHLMPPPSEKTPARQRPTQSPSSSSTQSKLQRIAAREGTGLKGFCPVVLRDERDLADSLPEYSAVYHGKTYFFSSEKALNTFLNNPRPYVPANGGNDVIHLALTGEELEGSLDNAVWYKGRLYLFSSVETMETFVAAPSSHAVTD